MRYLNKYNIYKGDFLLESLNESIDVGSFTSKIKNYLSNLNKNQIKEYYKKFIEKVSKLPKTTKKAILIGVIPIFALNLSSADLEQSSDPVVIEVVSEVETLEVQEPVEEIVEDNFKKGYDFVLTQNGWDSIRDEEKLRLYPYDIGDGKITVGWGHAEDITTSKYKIGNKISKEEAQKLLKDDLTLAADAVRQVFVEWKEKDIDVEITQDMFDALVSITFNIGVGGMRNSDFIQDLKKGDYKACANSMRIHKSNLFEKFPGLETRRGREADIYLKNY
jgi:lysozyme